MRSTPLLLVACLAAFMASAQAIAVCDSGWDYRYQPSKNGQSYGDKNGERAGSGGGVGVEWGRERHECAAHWSSEQGVHATQQLIHVLLYDHQPGLRHVLTIRPPASHAPLQPT